jgi:S-adenosylmethionine:tRNA ribosyltransferase-isomerase
MRIFSTPSVTLSGQGFRCGVLKNSGKEMKLEDLDFSYPENLIAIEPQRPSRIMWVESVGSTELTGKAELISKFQAGDCLVVNDTKVLKRRVFSATELEILFLGPTDTGSLRRWQVLCPSSRWREGTVQTLPGGVELQLLSRGRIQVIETNRDLDDSYFERLGEMPLPPYIQKARGERHNRALDERVYQTAWAKSAGSLAAPTASLHFSQMDLQALRERGVHVHTVTLHVGLGTFLPVTTPTLEEHLMHAEAVEISAEDWQGIQDVRASGHQVWALGTTVARSLESAAHGRLTPKFGGGFVGKTDLFICPGFEWRVVDRLLTNFHQPRSTLLALVAAFAGLTHVQKAYEWAIKREFRLFSYGDLSVWSK